jgi:hypothetical protein
MKCFVQNVFENTGKNNNTNFSSSFLQKIQDYHEETGLPVSVPVRLKPPPRDCSEEGKNGWLRTMKRRLLPHHFDLVRQYLPMTTLHTARETYIRTRYNQYKLQVAFVENATDQVRGYDPFFLTIDEVHESDMLLTLLVSKKLFYEEKIMGLRRKNNHELQPVGHFFAQCH